MTGRHFNTIQRVLELRQVGPLRELEEALAALAHLEREYNTLQAERRSYAMRARSAELVLQQVQQLLDEREVRDDKQGDAQ